MPTKCKLQFFLLQNYKTDHLKNGKQIKLKKIEESAGQEKTSFAKLARRVCKYLIIFNIDSSCW